MSLHDILIGEGGEDMDNFRIGICDRDTTYAVALMEALRKSKEIHSEITAFSGLGALDRYLKVSDLQLLILEEELYFESKKMQCKSEYLRNGDLQPDHLQPGDSIQDDLIHDHLQQQKAVIDKNQGDKEYCGIPVLILTNEKSDGVNFVCKFRNVNEIIQAVKKHLNNIIGEEKGTEIFAVYSPLGRCGCTTFSKALAVNTTGNGLYVGMENFSAVHAADELLYLLKTGSPGLEEVIHKNISSNNGMWELYASGAYLDSRDVTYEDIKILNEELLKMGRFSRIVYDIGSAVPGDFSMFRCFSRIFVPVLRNECSQAKSDKFYKILKEMGEEKTRIRMEEIFVPDKEIQSQDLKNIVQSMVCSMAQNET